MNYYEKHIGDYIRDTVSLTMLEDGAYNRLMDQCYQTERPLPLDRKMVYRLARANSAPERKAVDFVIANFFELVEGVGYEQKRIRAEIDRYQEKNGDAEGRRESERERQRRHRERRKQLFQALREHGEVPPYDTSTEELQAMLSRVTSRDTSQNVTPPVTRDVTANQTPDTRHQIKPTEPIGSAADASPSDPKAMIFSLGVRLLVGAGSSDTAARSFLGKHAKGDEAKLAEVIGYLAANPKIEPKAYIAAAMTPKRPELVL